MERQRHATGPAEHAARKPRPDRRDAHPVLALQRSAGNAAVVQAVQRSSLWERAKEAVGAEDKSALEITAEDMNEQLEKVIDKLEKAQKVLPAGQLKEGCEG